MGVGDVGADEFGNVTRLSAAQQQSYISGALALGASRADIDSFIANNGVNDLARINQALDLHAYAAPASSSPGPGVNTSSYSASVAAAASTPPSYAVPTPVSVNPGITPGPEDSRLYGSGGSSGSAAGGEGGQVNLSVAPASSGFPMWLLLGLVGIGVLAFVMDRRG